MTFYTVSEIAALLKVSPSKVYALIDDGCLHHYRVSTRKQGCIRVSNEQLQEYLRASASGEDRERKAHKLRHLV